jgi:hypothetical protein
MTMKTSDGQEKEELEITQPNWTGQLENVTCPSGV